MRNHWQKQFEPLMLLKRTLLTVLSVSAAFCVFVFYILLTPHGAKTAINLVQYTTPYQIEYEEIEGTLVQGLNFQKIHVQGPQLQFQAHDLEIRYPFMAILKGQYALDSLKAQHMRLQTKFEQHESLDLNLSSLPHLRNLLKELFPVPLKITNIDIEDAKIIVNDYRHTIDKLLIDNASEDLYSIQKIFYKGSLGKIEAFFDETIKMHWDIQLANHPLLKVYNSHTLSSQGSILIPRDHIEHSKVDMNLELNQFVYNQHTLQNLKFHVQGALPKHTIAMNGMYQKHPLQLVFDGQYSNQQWKMAVKKLHSSKPLWDPLYAAGQINIDWQTPTIRTQLQMVFSDILPIHAHIEIDKANQSLQGNVKTTLNDVRKLSFLFSNLAHLQSSLNADLQLSGTLFKPQVSGNILLKDLKLKTPSMGKKASLNTLSIQLANNKIQVNGDGAWGKGQFSIQGQGQITPPTSLSLNLKGNKLLLSDTPEYYIVASPDLKISIVNQKPQLSGQIYIDEADIRTMKNHPLTSSTDDVVIVSSQKKIKNFPQHSFDKLSPINSQIELILSNKITYKGYGISTHVTGNLLINQEYGQAAKARGKLQFRNGTYKGYGKTFKITDGEILFSGGPIFNPTINLHAERVIQTQRLLGQFSKTQPITCGVHFSGYLKSPQIAFYSDPTMSDADIMSYLVVGRPQSEIQGAQAEMLYEAVSHLTRLVGSNRKDVNFDLAEQFHLTQIGLSKKEGYVTNHSLASQSNNHNPLENTVFVLGKQLSDKLYLQYSRGILDSASTFGIQYNLGKNVTVEAGTGTQGTSADVLLSFEGH